MLPIAYYLLKVIICSGIFYAYYWLSLRNKIFHKYNRFYLMTSVMLSLLLPLIKINLWQQDTQQPNAVFKVLQAVSSSDEYMDNIIVTAQSNSFDLEQLYPLAYLLVSAILLIVFFHTLYVIYNLLKKYPKQTIDTISFINTDAKSTPFSFFNYIFWNHNIDMETITGNQIFKHELAHVQEKHTHDKFFINIILIFFWCNPFFWLYRKELNMIHEFIADKKAVEDSDTEAFAAMILQATYPQHRFQLTNNFFYSPIKRRLLMLMKNKNPRVNYFGRIMVLPLAVLIFAAFTFKVKNNNGRDNMLQTVAQVSGKSDTENYFLSTLNKLPTISDSVVQGCFVNVKHTDTSYLKSNDYKTKALVIIDGKEMGNVGYNYVEQSNTTYSSIVIYNPYEASKIYGTRGRYGVIKLTQKDAIFLTGDSVFYNDKTKLIRLSGSNTTIKGNLENTLIYVEGKQITPLQLNEINPSTISCVSILKGEKLDEIVEAKGKTAVINISLKPAELEEVIVEGKLISTRSDLADVVVEERVKTNPSIRLSNLGEVVVEGKQTSSPLYVINNKVQSTDFNLNTISPDNIERIDVLKDNSAINKYGDNAKNGVIEITTKNKEFDLVKVEDINIGTAVIAVDKMNVLYIGINNPISVAAPGIAPQDIQLSISQGSLSGADGKYIAQVTSPGDATITLTKKGSDKVIQTFNFQVKRVPDPVEITVTGKRSRTPVAGTQLPTEEQWQKAAEVKEVTVTGYPKKTNDIKEVTVTGFPTFTKTEVIPAYPGGSEAWKTFLMKNLNPSVPVDEGWKPGTYTVIVQFIVHTDGSVSDVTAINYQGSKTAQHCIDLIKKSAAWLPALQNGHKVNAYRKQPITFVIEGAKKDITIYSVPLKAHLLNDGKETVYNMAGNGNFTLKSDQLFLVDGKISSNPSTIKKEKIATIESYDAGSGKINFGDKGKHGVTLITTKG